MRKLHIEFGNDRKMGNASMVSKKKKKSGTIGLSYPCRGCEAQSASDPSRRESKDNPEIARLFDQNISRGFRMGTSGKVDRLGKKVQYLFKI